MERIVVVTGTSRGIGRATALRLARNGFRVFATVRSGDDADRLAAESEGRVQTLILDLAKDESIRAATDELTRLRLNALYGLVNVAAAQGRAVPLEAVTRADLDEQLAVTATGAAVLTAALLPFLRPARGRVVNVGAGALAIPFFGTTFVAKHALETMSDVLRIEVAAYGVRVIVVEPGMTRWDDVQAQAHAYAKAVEEGVAGVEGSGQARYRRAGEALKRLNGRRLDRARSADAVAATIERALTARRPRARYYCGNDAKLGALLARAAPAAARDRALRRLVRL